MDRYQPYIVGFGVAGIDYLVVAPAVDGAGFSRVDSFEVQGGGLTGTSCVAASRLGARTKLLSRLGDDEIGDQVIGSLKAERVDTSDIIQVYGGKSMFSCIIVDADTGERKIYTRRDTDMDCDTDRIALNTIKGAGALLLDDHWPEGARVVAKYANETGVPVICDIRLREENFDLLQHVDYAVISESYALGATDTDDHYEAMRKMLDMGCRTAVVTCGERGSYYMDESLKGHIPTFQVQAVDTTGSGDVFHGAFAVGISLGWQLQDIIRFASAVAAMKCTQIGGRAGIPTFAATMSFLDDRGVKVPSDI